MSSAKSGKVRSPAQRVVKAANAPQRSVRRTQRAAKEQESMRELDMFLDRLNAKADALLADIRRVSERIGG